MRRHIAAGNASVEQSEDAKRDADDSDEMDATVVISRTLP